MFVGEVSVLTSKGHTAASAEKVSDYRPIAKHVSVGDVQLVKSKIICRFVQTLMNARKTCECVETASVKIPLALTSATVAMVSL
jgi:hypothetical protein